MDLDAVLAATFTLVAPHLTEWQGRLLLGAAARALGDGGSAGPHGWPRRRGRRSAVACPSWTSRPTRGGAVASTTAPSGGVTPIPGLLAALDRLVEPDTRGDPQSPLRWTCKSTRELAQALIALGHPLSDDRVGRLLKQQGYRPQRTAKTLEGAQHAVRDAQFRYLNKQARMQLAAGQPVVSVDAENKELVGRFANGGWEWQPSGEPEQGNVHNVPDPTPPGTSKWNYRMRPAADKPPPTARSSSTTLEASM